MRKFLPLRYLLLISFVVTSAAPAAAGFGKWPQASPGSPVTITYSYSNLLDGNLLNKQDEPVTPGFLKDAIDEALGTWASYAPLNFVEVEDNGPPASDAQYSGSDFGQIRFGHEPFPATSIDFKAHAYFPIGGNLAGDVHFDNTNRWEPIGHVDPDPVTGGDFPDVLGGAIHEIGHSIGIGHSAIDGANMFPRFLRHTGPGSGHLHPDDIAAVEAVYGSGVGSVSPIIETIDPYFDIRPRGEWNRVRLFGNGMLQMTVLSGDGLDASQIDIETLEFGDPLLLGNGGMPVMPKQTKIRDVNWDGLPDLALVFRTRDLFEAGALGPETTEGTLNGVLFDGTRIAGTDAIEIVAPRQCEDWDHGGKWARAKEWVRDHYKDFEHDKNWDREGEWANARDWVRDHFKDFEHDRDWDWDRDGEWAHDKDWNHGHDDEWDHDGDWGSDDEWDHDSDDEWGHNGDWDHDGEWSRDGDWDHDRDWDHEWGSGHRHHGHRCSDGQETPEPTTMVLALMGIAGASVGRKRG